MIAETRFEIGQLLAPLWLSTELPALSSEN